MDWNKNIFALICGGVAFVGAVNISYQIYKMTIIDATARGLKRPKLWGLLAMNKSNVLIYIISRRKYPIIHMSDADYKNIETRKKTIKIGLIFLVVGTIGLLIYATLLHVKN